MSMGKDENVGFGHSFVDPARVVERSRGCWNCISFCNTELAVEKYKQVRSQARLELNFRRTGHMDKAGDDAPMSHEYYREFAVLTRNGMSEEQASQVALANERTRRGTRRGPETRFQLFDELFSTGQAGICMAGHAPSEFVHCQFLCEHWTARQGASVATEGQPLDKLPDELVAYAGTDSKRR